ncbi:hypothetical protein [Actinokineospora sp. NPDC004072]
MDECDRCYAMRIRMWGFRPHAEFEVVPHSSDWDSPFNSGATLTIDADGTEEFDRFVLGPHDHVVWVVVTIDGREVESNRYRWPVH